MLTDVKESNRKTCQTHAVLRCATGEGREHTAEAVRLRGQIRSRCRPPRERRLGLRGKPVFVSSLHVACFRSLVWSVVHSLIAVFVRLLIHSSACWFVLFVFLFYGRVWSSTVRFDCGAFVAMRCGLFGCGAFALCYGTALCFRSFVHSFFRSFVFSFVHPFVLSTVRLFVCFAVRVEQGATVGGQKSSTEKDNKSAKRKAPAASKKRSNPDGGATTGKRRDRRRVVSLLQLLT